MQKPKLPKKDKMYMLTSTADTNQIIDYLEERIKKLEKK